MEGGRGRGACWDAARAAIGYAVALAAAGCGGSATGTVDTADPALTFAPLVELQPGERHLPMGARWFLNRSALWFSDDEGCSHRKVAVGRALEAQRNDVVDRMFLTGLGRGPHYERIRYDSDCRYDVGFTVYANQLTRPHERRGRPEYLNLGEGYYLDLMNWARPGPDALALDGTPAYVERRREEVGHGPGLRLSYWLLFGMNEPRDRDGEVVGDRVHEGDWERVEVVLRGADGAYEPVSIRLPRSDRDTVVAARSREVPWDSLELVGAAGPSGGDAAPDATHPVLSAVRGSHALVPARAGSCVACRHWRTWRALEDAARQPWYGFGGAWGDLGPTSATTGPLGPGARRPPPRP